MLFDVHKYDYQIIGGGIVGLATAYQLSVAKPGCKILLLEKETKLGQHQTTHNSGVLHAGLYYKPNSLKAKLSVQGLRKMVAFCKKHNIAHEQCGKIVLATNEQERERLEHLLMRGNANGLKNLKMLNVEQIREYEPYAWGVAAIHVPEEGIVDYAGVVKALHQQLKNREVTVLTGRRVINLKHKNDCWNSYTPYESFSSTHVITCCGLYSDRMARLTQTKGSGMIVPFRGEYYNIKKNRQHLVRNLIYPVPDSRFPFLGVHFTRMIEGGVEAGPNAVLALSREGYSWKHFNLQDTLQTLAYPGLWRFLVRYPSICGYEIYRSFSKKEFCRSLQQLVPAITMDDLEPGPSGVRAQVMRINGSLEEDFQFVRGKNILHVINAPSPAATASFAIAEYIVNNLD